MDTTETSASAAAATPTSSFVIDEWIKTGKTYQDVPHFVSLELQHRVVTPAEARALLPVQTQKPLIVAAVGKLLARRRQKGTGGDDDD